MEKFEHLDWIIANKDFLKNLGLFEYIASSIKKWLEDSKQLSKIADNEDSLEIADDIKSEIANNAIKLINKTSDLQFIENVNVQSFLSKEDKKNIFDKFKNIFADSDESLEKRKDVARLLLKSNAIWNEIEVNDIYDVLKKIKKTKLGKVQELKDKQKEILDSWGYDQLEEGAVKKEE